MLLAFSFYYREQVDKIVEIVANKRRCTLVEERVMDVWRKRFTCSYDSIVEKLFYPLVHFDLFKYAFLLIL